MPLDTVRQNLRAIGRSLMLWPSDGERLTESGHALALWLTAELFLVIGGGYLVTPRARFWLWGFTDWVALIGVLVVGAYLAARLLARPRAEFPVLIRHAALLPGLTVAWFLWANTLSGAGRIWPRLPDDLALVGKVMVPLWLTLALARTLRDKWPVPWWRAGGSATLYTVIVFLSMSGLGGINFWYSAARPSHAAQHPVLDQEAIYYAQGRRLREALAGLANDHASHTSHYYFLGYAGDGAENVFRHEVVYARRLFDRRFNTTHRSVVLINNPATVTRYPIASVTNLRRALRAIGRRMGPHDVLVLFLTSHGAPGLLETDLSPLDLDDLTPKALADALHDAGIHYRVVVVSSCYSGSFLPALASPDALVATAASATRTSFGCSTLAHFTYFGRALLVDALPTTHNLITAVTIADHDIAARETRENLRHSDPQLSVGKTIAPVLTQLARPPSP